MRRIIVSLKNSDVIVEEVSRLVRLNPTVVMHVPQALQYLVTTDTILNDAPEVRFFVVIMKLFDLFVVKTNFIL